MNTVNEEQQLSQPITKFNFIFFSFTVISADTSVLQVSSELIPVDFITPNFGKAIYSVGGNIDTKAAVTFTDASTIKFIMKGMNEAVLGVYGLLL